MDGNGKKIIAELFDFAKQIMGEQKLYPFVSFIVKDSIIISRGFNSDRTGDVTLLDQVVSIRKAQESLDIGDLSGYTLYSLFEPPILSFDVALWSGIKKFVWCINSASLPDLYNNLKYTPVDYATAHPGEIEIIKGIREVEALELVKEAKQSNLYSGL